MSTWPEVRKDLEAGLYRKHRHVEIIMHPYAGDDGHRCVVFRRDPAPAAELSSPEDVMRNAINWFATRPLSRDAILFMIQRHPELVPWMLDRALESLVSKKPFTRNVGGLLGFGVVSCGFPVSGFAVSAFLGVDSGLVGGSVFLAPGVPVDGDCGVA
jgi:hypothetical protein